MKAPFKSPSTLFLKAVIIGIGAVVLALCAFLFPQIWVVVLRELPEYRHISYPALIAFFFSAVPFFFALHQAFRLLQYIDANNAFSTLSIRALKHIKYAAVAMTVLYAIALPLVILVAELDDAPGLGGLGMILTCAPLIVATFAAVLQKLVQSALDMKAEHDLTV